MPQPTPDWDLVELRGKFTGTNGRPIAGRIRFRPRATRLKDLDQLYDIVSREVAVTLVPVITDEATGAGYSTFTVQLPATDDPDITPNGFTYQVVEEFGGGGGLTFDIIVPLASAADGLDYTNLSDDGLAESGDPTYLADILAARNAATAANVAAQEERVAAEIARSGAEIARSGAEDARGAAQVAQVNSETARDAAAGSAAAAATGRDAAQIARSGAEDARGAAQVAQVNSETARDAAVGSAAAAAQSATDAQGYAQHAAGSVSLVAWAPATAYAAGDVRQAPDGSTIRRNTAGTSGAAFDATEEAAWTAIGAVAGTVEQKALTALFADVAAAKRETTVYVVAGQTSPAFNVYPTAAAAIAALGSTRGVVEFEPGTTYDMGNASLAVDCSLVRLRGWNTLLTWSAETVSGYALHLYSTADYSGRDRNWGTVMEGITLRGYEAVGYQRNGVGLRIGHNVHENNAMLKIADGGVHGFHTAVEFISNAWRVNLDNFNIQYGDVIATSGLSNFGECLNWRDSMFADDVTFTIGSGEWHFWGCSFDRAPVEIAGDAFLYFHGTHFETLGGAGYRLIKISHTNGGAALDHCHVVLNGGALFNMAPFEVISTATGRGLSLINCWLLQHGDFQPELTDGMRSLVAPGGGRAWIDGCHINGDFGSGYAFSDFSNLLRYGNAEAGVTTGWTTSGSATLSVQSTVKNRGSHAYQYAASGGTNGVAYAEFPVRPGRWVMGQVWVDARTTGSGAGVGRWLSFHDASGAQIGPSSRYSSSTGVSFYAMCGLAPAGAVTARVYMQAISGGSGGTADVYFDDAVFNVA